MSSTISQIRAATKTTLEAAIQNLVVYEKAGDVTQSPSVVLVPKTENTLPNFGDSTGGIYDFELIVMCERQPIEVAQARMDALVDKGNSTSIPRVINESDNLGLSDVCVFVGKMTDYGKEYQAQGVTYLGAVLAMKVVVT
jgi:hypothetical protein